MGMFQFGSGMGINYALGYLTIKSGYLHCAMFATEIKERHTNVKEALGI